jgi:hypothetical protein
LLPLVVFLVLLLLLLLGSFVAMLLSLIELFEVDDLEDIMFSDFLWFFLEPNPEGNMLLSDMKISSCCSM